MKPTIVAYCVWNLILGFFMIFDDGLLLLAILMDGYTPKSFLSYQSLVGAKIE